MKKIKALSKLILYTWKKANFVIIIKMRIIYEPTFFNVSTLSSDNHQRVIASYFYLKE